MLQAWAQNAKTTFYNMHYSCDRTPSPHFMGQGLMRMSVSTGAWPA